MSATVQYFRVGSRTRPYVWYLVALARDDETGEITGACNCPGDRWASDCAHVQHGKDQLGMTTPTTQALATIPDDERLALAAVPVAAPRRLIPDADEIRGIVELANRAPMAAGTALPAHLNNAGTAFACFLAGWELGVRPMTAARHIVVVHGRAEPDAQLMQGIVLANDPTAEFRIVEYSTEAATVELWRAQRKMHAEPTLRIRARYTLEDARRAEQGYRRKVDRWEPTGRGKDRPVFAIGADGQFVLEPVDGAWWTHTALMLCYNAIRVACKLGAPDIINGVLASTASMTEALAVAEQAVNETDWEIPRLSAGGEAVDLTTGTVRDPAVERRTLLAEMKARMTETGVDAGELSAIVGGRSVGWVEQWLRDTGSDLDDLFNQALDARRAPAQATVEPAPGDVPAPAADQDPSWPADVPAGRRGMAPRSHATESAQGAENGE